MPTVSRRLAFLAVAIVAVVGLASVAGAAHQSSGSSGSGTCSESPNPVALLGIYTITGAHLPANQIVNVTVSDSKGAQSGTVMTTSTGTLTETGQATVAGSYSVAITTSGRKVSTLATCGFRTS